MLNTDYRYYGGYFSFVCPDKGTGSLMQGPDFPIGDEVEVEFKQEGENRIAWVRNRYGRLAGSLSPEDSRELAIVMARGYTLRFYLALVAYTDMPKPGYYWGQIAMVANAPEYDDVFNGWAGRIAGMLSDGARPAIALETVEIERVLSTAGEWVPTERTPVPTPDCDDERAKTAVLKRDRSFNDKVVQMAREQRPGCLVTAWVFNIALLAGLVALILHWCGVY